MQNVQDLIRDIFDVIKNGVDETGIVGRPIVNGDGTIILPVSKISIGFVGGEMSKSQKEVDKGNEHTMQNLPLGITGGGVSVTPLGFLVCGKDKRFISVDNDCQNKWLTLIGDIANCIKKE